jgi:hypothetical protein
MVPTPTKFPKLRSLILSGGLSYHNPMDLLDIITLPYLRRLKVLDAAYSEPIFFSFVDRSKCALTHLALNIAGCPLAQFMHKLRDVSSLKVLEITTRSTGGEGIASKSPLPIFPKLTALTIDAHALYVNYGPLIGFLRSRRKDSCQIQLRASHLIFQRNEADEPDRGCDCRPTNTWRPGVLSASALKDLIDGGLRFVMGQGTSNTAGLPMPAGR